MKRKIEDILDQLVAEMKRGRTIDDCLREYPDYADRLRPLLQLAQEITDLPKPEPDVNAFKAVIDKTRRSAGAQGARKRFSLRRLIIQNTLLVRAVGVVVLIFLVGTTTVSLSARSLPGDLLYPVKKLTEDVQYFLTVDALGRARLHVRFADRRTYELSCLLQKKAPINQDLLAEMLSETKSAIDCTDFLDDETAAEIAGHLDACNHHQMELLEETKQSECDFDIRAIEEAIKTCIEQHHCIECIKGEDSAAGSNCPSQDAQYDHIPQ
jgi:hypothetical protein